MFSEYQFFVGGTAAAIIACLGTVFNCVTLYVLLGTSSMRTNPTTVLIMFLTASNLIYTSLVLPLTSASMLNTSYFEDNQVLCQLYSFFFFWTFLALLFIQVALAVNRWTVVCTEKFRFVLFSVIAFSTPLLVSQDYGVLCLAVLVGCHL